ENTENGGENFEVEEPNKIEEQKTPLEELLGDENITQQVENVLQTYEYNPVYKENFVNYLKNNKIFKKKFLEELKKIQ
ncbi:MAG: hypothetical protein LBG59_07765, partial [Candidatus Peribacteria bacterium]|nr:hypothetical protein [Candidatus Peribacteria bacterium]